MRSVFDKRYEEDGCRKMGYAKSVARRNSNGKFLWITHKVHPALKARFMRRRALNARGSSSKAHLDRRFKRRHGVPHMDDGSQLLKALIVLMLKILDNADRTSSFVVLINLLCPLDQSRWSSPASNESFASRNQKFSDLVAKCLIKLTKHELSHDVFLGKCCHCHFDEVVSEQNTRSGVFINLYASALSFHDVLFVLASNAKPKVVFEGLNPKFFNAAIPSI
ncbi:protein MOR1-like [Trifolium medium]|uniref:Protein MOR1-like n=1 Tax=Trifolium medium TaxID=97028 RepID=A0A392M0U6_9FABA|nr:protein MOR1-like [Trifolium medium]